MVAAVSTAAVNPKTAQSRPPLLPSESENGFANPSRRPKSREVTSRYMSSTSTPSSTSTSTSASTPSKNSKRCPSPLISRPTAGMTPAVSSAIKRSQSVERRRASTPRPLDLRFSNNGNSHSANGGSGGGAADMSNAQRMLITSTRSLSVSFQGESFSFQVSKAKPAPSPAGSRKGTPERRKAVTPARGGGGMDQVENSRLWPGRLRQQNLNSMSKSVDFTDDRKRVTGSGLNGSVVRTLQSSMMDNRSSIESRLSSDSSSTIDQRSDAAQCDHRLASDTESVSSGSTSESSGNAGGGGLARGPQGIVVPARFWQETNNRIRRQTLLDPGSPGSKTVGVKGPAPPRLIPPKKFGIDSPVSSPKGVANSRGQFSPIRGGVLRPASPSKLGGGALRPASPSKLGGGPSLSPMRGVSPSRVRNAVGAVVSNSNLGSMSSTPSILSFAADIKRVKSGENRIVEVHLLRILYNRWLQWRFVNARTDSALSAQKLNAEKNLYNACATISKLRDSVRAKKTELLWLRQNLKLTSILRGQMIYLEELALMEQDYSRSLTEAIEALRASTLRLPVVGGARADVQNVNDAICSAVDVMQAMASSIRLLLPRVEGVNSLVADLANATAKERALLNQCKDLLSTIAAMQVEEGSLRTHVLQLKRAFPA